MDKPRSFLGTVFFTTTGWAMICCLVGAATIFMPWGRGIPGFGKVDATVPPQPAEMFRQLPQLPPGGYYNGLFSWHGVVTCVAFAVLFLFLVATSPLYPVPLWRSILLFVGGSFVLLIVILFFGRFGGPLFRFGEGSYITLGLAFMLLFLSALEIRALLIRWTRPREVKLTPMTAEVFPAKRYEDKAPPSESAEEHRFRREI
jgi:hypothetical protein